MTDAELNAATEGLQFILDGYRDKNSWEGYPRMLRDGIAAITTLRAQLAEAEACNRGLVRLNEAIQARADRTEQRVATLEAALAAQIEADAGIITSRRAEMDAVGDALPSAVDRAVFREIVSLLNVVATAIRNQPHDRTALDRHDAKTREKALREAANALPPCGFCGGSETILALIEKPNAR